VSVLQRQPYLAQPVEDLLLLEQLAFRALRRDALSKVATAASIVG
jgi:hypothetical protein